MTIGALVRWILIAASPEIGAYAERAGVHQVMVDLETFGKAERQRYVDAHISSHGIADVPRFAKAVRRAELLVRINPLGAHSALEIDQSIAAGARRLMLPMFRTAIEVRGFLDLVGGRVPVTLLAETPEALATLEDYLGMLGPSDYVHFGLNDLRLGLGMRFVFEPMAAGLLEEPAQRLRAAGCSFGIGGIGRVGTGEVPAECVMGELVRLGAEWVILSRAFHGSAHSLGVLRSAFDLEGELAQLRATEAAFRTGSVDALNLNRERFVERVRSIVAATPAGL